MDEKRVYGPGRSDNDSSLLLRKGQPDPSTVVVVHQEVYADLRRAAIARLPGGTAGALLGSVQDMSGQLWYTVREAAALDLQFTENGLTPEPASLESLRRRVEAERWHELSVIGMFYADPEIGLFPARMDIGEIHRQLTPEASLLLLMNPSIDQGAFCLWREGMMLPVGGFYEALPEDSTSIIPWSGDWAAMLVGAAGTLKRPAATVEGRSGRAGGKTQEPTEPADGKVGRNGAEDFEMKATARPEPVPEAAQEEVELGPQDEPEDSMALDAVERMMSLARELEADGNLTGAVLLYRQAVLFAPIVGDVALELRLRSTLTRLEAQVSLLEQDITADASAAWAEIKERAAEAEAAEEAQVQATAKPRTAVDELFDVGMAAFWKGDMQYARSVLTEVVRQDPAYRTEHHRAANLLAGIERRLSLPPVSTERKGAVVTRRNAARKPKSEGISWRTVAAVALPLLAIALVLLFALTPGVAPSTQESRPPATARSVQPAPTVTVARANEPEAAIGAYVAVNGGTERYGLPVSPVIEEASDGVTRTVRYYERGLLAYDESAPSAEPVATLPLGTLEIARRYPQGAPEGRASTGEELYFGDTGFAISGAFREHWEQPGSSAAFGRPVSGVFEEAVEGAAPSLVQYFEFGAMRQVAGSVTAPIEAAPLGTERYRALYNGP